MDDQQALFDEIAAAPTTASASPRPRTDGPRPQWNERDLEEAQLQQFRLKQIQVLNWGTFSKLHVFDIAEVGHLLVGPSGAGKSSILDAHTALMAPPHSEFNAAARGNDKVARDRTLVTYIRGAWAAQESDEGLIATRFLRPDTTLSAVAEVYANGQGQQLTLVGLWWIKGASTVAKDVRHCFFAAECAFSLKELNFFMQADYNLRLFEKHLPDIKPFPNHAPFRERFKARLGIDQDLALRLLHRTQSSKNLGDLNAFMRENMLDEPATFQFAKTLCDDFGTLAAAHAEVVEARLKRDLLDQGRIQHRIYAAEHEKAIRVDALLAQLEHQRDYLRFVLRGERIDELDRQVGGLRQDRDRLAKEAQSEEDALDRLKDRRRGMDDGDVADLERELKSRQEQISTVGRSKKRIQGWLRTLGWTEPTDARAFGQRVSEAQQISERGPAAQDEAREAQLRTRLVEIEQELAPLLKEVTSLELRRSNLPTELVDIRDQLARDLHLDTTMFPFGGELLEVRNEEAKWQGALERLLAPLTKSFLVPEAHYRAVVDWLEARNTGQHVLYLRMRAHDRLSQPHLRSPGSKLNLAVGDYGAWLGEELSQQYGDCICAESTEEFRRSARALTLNGQIKRGHVRHEKNDRRPSNDPTGRKDWCMGFSNEQKKLDLLGEITRLSTEKEDTELLLKGLRDKRARELGKLNAAAELSQAQWADFDERTPATEAERLQRSIAQARESHPELKKLDQDIEEQRQKLVKRQEEAAGAKTKYDERTEQQAALTRERDKTPEPLRVPPNDHDTLGALFRSAGGQLTLENLDTRRADARAELTQRKSVTEVEKNKALSRLEEVLRTFKNNHKIAAADIGTTLADWPDYERLLDKIEADDLPRFEDRFFALLNEQSDRHLAKLRQQLIKEKDEIRGRMDIVNNALSESNFNEGTYLRIQDRPRTLPDVQAFQNDLRSCLERNLKPDATREERETQFQALNALVQRLNSTKSEDERWRSLVLDVRQHVEFVAKEFNRDGQVVDIYQSGAGKSGGQRQKLAATCLAAALRYQLAGTSHPLPQFCTVFMDEAFDKADSEFTAMTLNIFNNFGFQMIMATPMKAVRTLEPFIGGAHVFSNKTKSDSAALAIEYDMTTRRLVGLERAEGRQQ
ncbi:MAG: SbcC/MukB-like Walker B domain-containing protein [Rubrivivax sp.]